MWMCGIAVGVAKDIGIAAGSTTREEMEQILTGMIEMMRHRGPDAEGMYLDEGIGLAMARLTIVGGDEGMQPIWNEDKSLVLVCNGEIYNHQDLRVWLEENGHQFSTSSDVEVIVHLYEALGEQCLTDLQGIFAFALWDVRQKKLLVARDRVGVKPLYYAETEHQLVFSSEFKSLLGIPGLQNDTNWQGFRAYHAFRFCPADETMVKGIQKLRPAHYLVVQAGKVSVQAYWEPTPMFQKTSTIIPMDVKAKRLKTCLYEAVERQAAPEVKSGILLSGGLDSTALLAIQRELLHEAPDTFTVAFAAPRQPANLFEYNETTEAREAAQAYGSNHFSECYTAQDVLEQLPQIVAALDEPIADPTAIPLWFAIRMARQNGAKVVYSGEGLDELFNGYSVYRQVHWLNVLTWIPPAIRQAALSAISRLGMPGRGILSRSLAPASDWYQGIGAVFTSEEVEHLLQGEAWSEVSRLIPREYVQETMEPAQDASTLTQMTYFDLLAWLPENTLVKSDKISMAQSVELRVPFLHEAIVDLALELEDADKLRHGVGKWVVREALKDVILPNARKRPKAGFPIPLTAWMFDEWKEFVLTTLMDPNAHTCGMYKKEYVEGLYLVPEKQRRRAARQLWTLLNLELWHRYVYGVHTQVKPQEAVVCG
jgi:asparagine synthase (glutamine-hydrolysing)